MMNQEKISVFFRVNKVLAIFALKKKTAVFAETLDNFQRSTRLIPESCSCTLSSSCENLRTRTVTFCYIVQIRVAYVYAMHSSIYNSANTKQVRYFLHGGMLWFGCPVICVSHIQCNFKEQNPSWVNSCSASHEISHLLWNQKVNSMFTSANQKSQSRDRWIHCSFPHYVFKIHFNITLPFMPRLSKWYFPLLLLN
jgi:hypothetical protein